jgi:uncharacterized membrane protein
MAPVTTAYDEEFMMGEPKRTRLVFLGFGDEGGAEAVLANVRSGVSAKDIVVEDWALIHKASGGKVTVRTDKSTDPGAVRGGLAGGGMGALFAVLSGPIGAGAVVGGAAIGAVTAAIKDSGFKNQDIEEVSKLMADDRTGLMIAVPLSEADRFDEFANSHRVYAIPDRRYQVDIVPGRTFERALEEYRLHEED